MAHDDDEVGGDKLNNFGSEFASAGIGVISGTLSIGLATILIGADLALGPFFLFAQADNMDISLSLLGKLTPWVFSIALTGLLYGMWETISLSYSKNWLKVLAVLINVGDTLTDIGGANWLITRNPDAGQQFWPPPGTDPKKVYVIYGIGIMCFLHEPLLGWLLAKYRKAIDPAEQFGQAGFGEKIEVVFVKLAGSILNFVKFAGKFGATFMLPALDLILTPLLIDFGDDKILWGCVAGWSFAVTAIQSRLWARVRELGGFKEAVARSTTDKAMVYGLLALVVVDTYLDIKGYNQALYGESGGWDNVIANPTPSWMITIAILIVLCSCGELLGREIFTILARKAATARKGGGSDDFDDMPLDDGGGGSDMPLDDDI